MHPLNVSTQKLTTKSVYKKCSEKSVQKVSTTSLGWEDPIHHSQRDWLTGEDLWKTLHTMTQTHKQTDGHRDSETESAQWAESVKISVIICTQPLRQLSCASSREAVLPSRSALSDLGLIADLFKKMLLNWSSFCLKSPLIGPKSTKSLIFNFSAFHIKPKKKLENFLKYRIFSNKS